MQCVTSSNYFLEKSRIFAPDMDSLPDKFEVVVVGTGFVESLVAGACARLGHTVLHLDTATYYGGDWASFTWEGLRQWVKEQASELPRGESNESSCKLGNKRTISNISEQWHQKKPDNSEEEDPINKEVEETEEVSDKTDKSVEWNSEKFAANSRKFNIDLVPRILFSRGSLVELLISSNISRYTEFKPVTRVLTRLNGVLEQVPSSRSDVFNTTHISVVEKRILMKFLTAAMAQNQEGNVDGSESFVSYLKSQHLTENLTHFVLHAIAMVRPNVSRAEGMEATRKFLSSLGRFGPTPFLWSNYGVGELPQAFCRLCAVYGGVYYLGRGVSGISIEDEEAKYIEIGAGQKIGFDKLVLPWNKCPQNLVNATEEQSTRIYRGIFITSGSILPAEKEQVTFLSLPPSPTDPSHTQPINLIEVGPSASACPQGLFVLQASTSEPSIDLRSCLAPLLGDSCLYSLTFTQESSESISSKLPNLWLAPGPQPETDFDLSIQQATNIFQGMYPGEEFLPRAPDPEEILIGEDDATESTENNKEFDEDEKTTKVRDNDKPTDINSCMDPDQNNSEGSIE